MPEIQHGLVQGQAVSADLPLPINEQTDKYVTKLIAGYLYIGG